MDRRRAAGALLALAACIACSAAAPTASNQTALDLYENAPEGCFYNFQHYGEGDRIMTNEPCLNCTCHNRMLMCYLRVCPFTKAIGQDCTVEKRDDQCCPIVTCPDVPVDLLTSTSTTSPAEYGATGIGKQDKYGCSINGRYFPEGSKVPPTPNKPCEHCYCIRNMTTCVMQECTLHVDGCTPIYHKDVCCPIRYSCDHEDEVPLLDDMTTTVRPTPGFLLTTTTLSPVTQMTQDCVHDDQIFSDGALIKTEKACQHCYCMKGDIVCVVQECGAPMENEGKNCTSLPPREGQCCPDTYICEGDELTSDLPSEPATDSMIETLTTLSPPRRTNVEGSGYRNEPDEAPYTEMTTATELEGSGEEPEPEISKPLGPKDIITTPGDEDQYIYSSTKAPIVDEHDKTTPEINKNIIPDEGEKIDEPHIYGPTTNAPVSEEKTTSKVTEEEISKPSTKVPEIQESTTDLGEEQNTVPDVIPKEEIGKPHEHVLITTNVPGTSETEVDVDKDSKIPEKEYTESDATRTTPTVTAESESPIHEEKESSKPDKVTSVTTSRPDEEVNESSRPDEHVPGTTSSPVEEEKESSKPDEYVAGTTSSPVEEEKESSKPDEYVPGTTSSPVEEDKESSKPDEYVPGTTSTPVEEEKESLKPDEYVPGTTSSPVEEKKESSKPDEYVPGTTSSPVEEDKESSKPDEHAPDTTSSPAEEEKEISKQDEVVSGTTGSSIDEEKESSKPDEKIPETTSSPTEEDKESLKPDEYVPGTTSSPVEEEKESSKPDEYATDTTSTPSADEKEVYKPGDVVSGTTGSPIEEEKEVSKPDEYIPGTISSPAEEDKESSKPDEYAPDSTSRPGEEEKESFEPDEVMPGTTSSPAEGIKASSKPDEFVPGATNSPVEEEKESVKPDEFAPESTSHPVDEEKESSKPDEYIPGTTSSPVEEEKEISKPDEVVYGTTESSIEEEKESSIPDEKVPGTTSSPIEEDKETSKPDEYIPGTTSSPAEEEKEVSKPGDVVPGTTSGPTVEEKESSKPEQLTTRSPLEEEQKLTTEPDHGENTVVIADEQSTPHAHLSSTTLAVSSVEEDKTTKPAVEQQTDKITKEDVVTQHEDFATESITKDSETTAEPDRGMNTIPEDIHEDATKVPVHSQSVDKTPTTVSEITTGHLDSTITRGDQSTVTTEPSFRKEDEIVSTEKSKEFGSTTIKPEFVDEGLIPTSAHDEKTVTSSDLPAIEDEFTTSVPEYITEIIETSEPKQTTTEPTRVISLVTEMLPEKTSEQDSSATPTTEKSSDITVGSEDIHEESSRIPGEGDCLLNGVTYRNNTVVPSTNNCHTGCRCASSIIKCDPIICSPPPDYMDNCQSIYDSPDSCCPTFVCDHPRETVPPQSDNQMSGTESPIPSPTIECRGDQCELSEPTKQPTGSSEPCTSDNCINEDDHKTDIQCDSEGCKGVEHKPDELPSKECPDGNCKSQDCAYGKCTLPQTDEQVSQQACKPGEECKEVPTIVAPCEGELCNKIDCGPNGCDQSNIAPQPDQQPELCNKEEGCKPQDIPTSDCTGDEPCRRKEVSDNSENLPSACEGPNCVIEKETTVAEGTELSTESPKTEKSPTDEILTPSTTEKTSEDIGQEQPVTEYESTKKPTSKEEMAAETPASTEKNQPTTDEDSKERPHEKTEDQGADSISTPTVTDDNENKPDVTEKEGTELPTTASEADTEKSVIIDEASTKKPVIDEEKDTDIPSVIDQESTDMPPVVNIETEKPSLIDDKDKPIDTEKDTTEPSVSTEKIIAGDDEGKVKPSDDEDKNEQSEIDVREREPDLTDKESTDKPAAETIAAETPDITMQETTTRVAVTGEEDKEITKAPIDLGENDIETSTFIDKDGADKDLTQKPASEEENKHPDLIDTEPLEEDKKEIVHVEHESTERPVTDSILSGETPSTPAQVEEEKSTESPSVPSDKPSYVNEDNEKSSLEEKENEKKPIDRESTELPLDISSEKPVEGDEENKEKPITNDTDQKPIDTTEEQTMKPFTDGESTALPDFTEKESTDKPVIIDEGTEEPAVIEKDTTKPDFAEKEETKKPAFEESKDKPDVTEKSIEDLPVSETYTTSKPVRIDGENQVKPVDEVDTEKPILVGENEKPVGDKEAEKEKPVIIDEDITDKPSIVDVKVTDKPIIHEEEGSGSDGLEVTPGTEVEKEEKLPETSIETTEAAMTEVDKITKAPVYESQSTATELNIETMDVSTSTKSPIKQVSDSEENKVTDIHETSQMSETATESRLEQELTTRSPVSIHETVTTVKQQEQEYSSTVAPDLSSESLSTKATEIQESSKPIGEEEDISTDSPDIETTSIKLPETGPVIIEPQDGFDTESPELHKPTEESATKVYEKDEDKLTPEPHVTETSTLPVIDTSDKEYHVTVETTHDDESKTQRPDLASSEKEEMITDSVTEPIRTFTEVEDPSVTGQGGVTTAYPEDSTKHRLPSVTDKLEENDVGATSSDKPLTIDTDTEEAEMPVTKTPEHMQEVEKEKPTTSEFELPTTEKTLITDSQEISHIPEEVTTRFEQKTTAIPDLSEHKHKDTTSLESETTQHSTEELTKISEYVTEPYVTEVKETSTKSEEKDVIHAQPDEEIEHETKSPEPMPTHDVDKKEPSDTEIEKQPTEQPLVEINVQTEMPSVQVTSEVPQSLVTEQKETINEQMTVASIPKEESTQKPEVMSTQYEEISKVPDVHGEHDVRTEVPVHITESVEASSMPTDQEKDAVTEKQDTATTLRESPTVTEKVEQTEVTKITEHTSAETDHSETTPYLIELEEHTHKMVDDTTTALPFDEEHSYKPVEDISKPTPSEDEHSGKPVVEPSETTPSEEDLSNKPIEGVSTSSPTEEEHSYKPVEEGSTSIPSEEEHSLKPIEVITTSLPTQEEHSYKPEQETSTSSPSVDEHSYKPVEESSTLSATDEVHSDKPVEEVFTSSPSDEEHSYKPVEDTSSVSPSVEDFTVKIEEHITTALPSEEKLTTEHQESSREPEVTELPTKVTDEVETHTKSSEVPQDISEKVTESVPADETTPAAAKDEDKYDADHKESTTSAPIEITEESSSPAVATESEKLPSSESDNTAPTEKEIAATEKPSPPIASQETTKPEEIVFSTTKATTVREGDEFDDKFDKPEEKPVETSENLPSSTTTETSKPSVPDLQSTDELPSPGEDDHFPPGTGPGGYGEPDYVEEDQAFGPGTCRYGGKVYVSAQQIPRDDPCDFCFCFRSDIICLQQSCPPPIHGCHEEPIQGFCCPRYECPVSMATTVNVTTTTTTTTTTLPPHFPTHSYKGAAQRRGCQIKGHTYKVGEVVRSSSGPCLHCTCGGDGQMKCDPKACTPEPMLRQMIAAAVSAKRRR
ncbi:titin [Spodoptera litura]|uniref:Titin n=1 Tax=Spodoptera litura TaxID=69820 RepID=A0A9J7ILU7_SPOLT|nr:titin [Spodoptera litura]